MNFNTDKISLSYCKSIFANIHTLVRRLNETRKESALKMMVIKSRASITDRVPFFSQICT